MSLRVIPASSVWWCSIKMSSNKSDVNDDDDEGLFKLKFLHWGLISLQLFYEYFKLFTKIIDNKKELLNHVEIIEKKSRSAVLLRFCEEKYEKFLWRKMQDWVVNWNELWIFLHQGESQLGQKASSFISFSFSTWTEYLWIVAKPNSSHYLSTSPFTIYFGVLFPTFQFPPIGARKFNSKGH